jgi:selenocysteine-specific elongation factor
VQVIATAGHVDHGKSTLVRALTGMQPDRWAQEQRRGLTIGLGFVWTELPGGRTVAFVDVPGHERFVGTMLAGVGPVPAVLFVVAADEGWMPQSAEHLDALAALGTEHGLLVITRSDLASPEQAMREAQHQLAGTSLAGLTPVCVSATSGMGMAELRAELAALCDRLPAPDPGADVRLWVDRVFTVRGAGTVVTGTLPAGQLGADDQVILWPNGQPVTVRGLQALGQPVTRATGVARVAVNLRGATTGSVHRGDALVTPDRWLPTGVLDVRLHPVRADQPPGGLVEQLVLHVGAAAVPVRVRPLGPDTARLTLRGPLPLRIGDRALLRDPGGHRIVAGLTVLDVAPPELSRRGDSARRAARLAVFTGVPDAAAEVARRGVVQRQQLIAMGADPATLGDEVLTAGEWLLHSDRAALLAKQLVAVATEHAGANPLEPGLPLGAARRTLELADNRLVELVVRAAPGRLVLRAGRVLRAETAGHDLPTKLREALGAVRQELTAQPFAAPSANRLAELGLGRKELAALVRAGELEHIGGGIYLLPGAEQAAVRVLAELGTPEFTLSAAREALGTTRRVAMPLLELLARRGRTSRTEDGGHRLIR